MDKHDIMVAVTIVASIIAFAGFVVTMYRFFELVGR